MEGKPIWGWWSFARGLEVPEEKTLAELAARSEKDLLHVVNVLLANGSEEAVEMAERFFDANA